MGVLIDLFEEGERAGTGAERIGEGAGELSQAERLSKNLFGESSSAGRNEIQKLDTLFTELKPPPEFSESTLLENSENLEQEDKALLEELASRDPPSISAEETTKLEEIGQKLQGTEGVDPLGNDMAEAERVAAATGAADEAAADAASGTGSIEEESEEVAEDIANQADSNAASEKTGGLSKAKAAAGVLAGGAAITVAVAVGYGIKEGTNSDNPDDCESLPPVSKQSCKETMLARKEYHETIEGFNNAMDNFFDFANLFGLYGILICFVLIPVLILIFKIVTKSMDKKTGGVILYGLILILVSSYAIPFSMWFFRSPRQNCTKPTSLASVDSTCSLLLQSGSCFRSSPNSLDTYLQNPCIKKSFISSPTYPHDYNILINGERANNSLNYVEMYSPNDLPWEWKLPGFQENSQCQYYKHGSPFPLSSPPQITCSSPTSVTDIDDTSVGSYRGEPEDLLLYPRIALGIVFAFIILCFFSSIRDFLFKSSDSQTKEYLEDHPGAKIDSKAEWKESVEKKQRGKIMEKVSSVEQAAKGFAEGLAKSREGGNQKGGFLNTKKFKKLNKYNKWLIVFLIIFAMIITHFYKKQRGIQKDQQYLQQLKQLKQKRSPNNLQNNFKNDSKVQPYQPDNVFNGQYL